MTLSVEWVSGLISFVLTLAILSYLIGDNPLFRLVTHLFVGVSAGYIAAVVFTQVWMNRLLLPLTDPRLGLGERLWLLLSLFLAVLLLTKISYRLGVLGTPVLALLSGIAAALVIGGAVQGTLLPQAQAATAPFSPTSPLETWLQGTLMLLGTIGTLAYFHFGVRATSPNARPRLWLRLPGWIGAIFLGITLGSLFTALYSTALTALIERLNSILTFLLP